MNLRQLKSLTTSRSFSRGEAYFNEGRVGNLAEDDGTLTATVEGQRDYRVSLHSGKSKIEYSCDCPVGLDREFCKHLVAATLAWITPEPNVASKTGERKKRETNEEKVKAFLQIQDKETLIGILTSEAAENRALRERLLLSCPHQSQRR
ncbi:MAG: SWIM zinc finger family protein [Pyrinomonadaceae bacterium]